MFTVRSSIAELISLILIGALSATVAAEGRTTHVVAADGSGDFSTIGEAITAATVGDTILVKPGFYAESLVIDKGITLRGDGPRGEITLDVPEFALVDPAGAVQPTLLLRDANAIVSGLTILGTRRQGGVVVSGGMPLLEDNAIGATVRISGPSLAVFRGNALLDFADIVVTAGATGRIEDNDFSGGSVRIDGGWHVEVRDNTITALANVIGEPGIDVRGPGATASVEGNVVTGSGIGISVADGASAFIEGNELRGNGIGIAWFAWQRGLIAANSVCGASVDVWVAEGSGAEITDTQACEDEPVG